MSTSPRRYVDDFRCPQCGAKTSTVDSRWYESLRHRRRRRECANKHRFSTNEAIVDDFEKDMMIVRFDSLLDQIREFRKEFGR